MEPGAAIALVARLADVAQRDAAARQLARAMGADELLIFLRDPDAKAMLPAPGWRRTLPGGEAWRDLLGRIDQPGLHRSKVPWPGSPATQPVVACSDANLAILAIGGHVDEADARLVGLTIPLLHAALRAQHGLATAAGELQAARSEIRQATALMKALDETRAQLDRSLVELATQARSLEEARAKTELAMRSKDEFMAMLGHELRNPLAPFKTALDLLRMRGIWSQEHDVMQRQANHMIRLVEDLLDVSRIAGGKLTLQRVPTEVSSILARALETAAPLIDQRRQRVELQVPDTGLCVNGDPARLAQVFSNLLANAAKYSDIDGRIEVTAVQAGDMARISVTDHGIGIEAGMLEDVFVLFHQQGRGLDRAQGGLGLGLAIVRNLVTLHDGKVEAASAGPGHGSTFTVELPLCDAADLARMASAQDTTPVPARQGLRILLVDDNADARSTLTQALRAYGHHVSPAADALEAMRMVDDARPDVAVLDIGLPVVDGYELARQLRLRPGKPIPMVAVTGYGQPEDKARARAAGFVAHFVKPVDVARLAGMVASLA
jgi:signal transduction histidine kinase